MDVNLQNDGTSNNDSFDINELAYLDEDITPEFIEQLQKNAMQSANILNNNNGKLDVNMFEEVQTKQQTETTSSKNQKQQEEVSATKEENTANKTSEDKEEKSSETETKQANETAENKSSDSVKELEMSKSIDDNFLKKYKAKLNKQPQNKENTSVNNSTQSHTEAGQNSDGSEYKSGEAGYSSDEVEHKNIEELSGGNITEREVTQEQLDYEASLDYVDDNIKYSKYVIYIAPENTEFIESLTVKERKNLINKILSEQGSVILNKKKIDTVKLIFRQIVIAIITISIMIPVMYKIFNYSLEATIDNNNRAKSNFQTLYKQHGKIKQQH